jgi:hypothetical protein
MTLQIDLKTTPAVGGDMSWKKALFLGGAVMLLAACSDATAPTPLRSGAPTAAIMSGAGTATSTSDPVVNIIGDDCRSGYYVRSGDKDFCLDQLLPQ